MSKGGYPMPEVIAPLASRHVCIPVPDEPRHRQAFLGNLLQLARPWNWGEGKTPGDEDVAAVWREIWLDTALQLDQAYENCGERIVDPCVRYAPAAPWIEWYPHHPFNEPDEIPAGYRVPAWLVGGLSLPQFVEDILEFLADLSPSLDLQKLLFGIAPGDVTTWMYNFLPSFINPFDPMTPLESSLPGFRFTVQGAGTVRLCFNQVPAGGVALVSIDSPIDLVDVFASIIDPGAEVVELNIDVAQLPPEDDTDAIEEYVIDTDGEHVIEVQFLPVLDDAFIPVRFGGGLKWIELCGFEVRPTGGEINMPSDPCGCESLRDILNDALLGAAYGLFNQAIPPGSSIGDPGSEDGGTGENGRINPGQGTVIEPPTPPVVDEFGSMEAAAGAAWKAANRFYEGFSDLLQFMQETTCFDGQSWFTPFEQTCTDYVYGMMSAIYDIDRTALENFIVWFTEIATATYVITPAELAEYFFCVGVNSQAVARYAIDEKADEERNFYLYLRDVFNPGQYTYWAQIGAAQPRTDYGAFPCVLRPTIEYTFSPADIGSDFNNRSIIPDSAWLARDKKTLIYITLSGTVTDGSIQEDPLYRFDTQSPERRFIGLHFKQSSPVKPVPAEEDFPPYNPNHVYTFAYELPAGAAGEWRLFWDANTDFGIWPSGYDSAQGTATGQFTIKIVDGGII